MNLLTADSSMKNGRVALVPDRVSFSGDAPLSVRIPFVMPREQMYYWTPAWQNGEHEALSEKAAGQIVRFDSDDPEDIARWLDEPGG